METGDEDRVPLVAKVSGAESVLYCNVVRGRYIV